MIIDAHQHFWEPARGDYGWIEPGSAFDHIFLPDDLAPFLTEAGVTATILVQAAPSQAETDFLLSIARRTSWVVGVVGWVALDADDVAAQIAARAADPHFVGVRPMLQDLPMADWILQPRLEAGLRGLVECNLVFDALVRAPQVRHIRTLADRHPDLAIVLDHAGKPPFGDRAAMHDWAREITQLAERPNVACKLSGLLTGSPSRDLDEIGSCIDLLVRLFPADRLIWGSDWPVLTTAGDYRTWFEYCRSAIAERRPNDIDIIFGGNARAIYGLSISSASEVERTP